MSDTTTDKQPNADDASAEATDKAAAQADGASADTQTAQPAGDEAGATATDEAAPAAEAGAADAATASADATAETGGDAADDEGAADGAAAPEPEKAAKPPEPTPEERLEASRNATKAMKEKMLRIAADFENFRRRSNKEVEDARKRGTQSAVKDLFPVFDNLERATAHVDDKTDVQSMLDGLRMVHKQFTDVLAKMGIERVDALGKGFDPALHESIQYEHSDDYEAGIVMNVLQPGYRQGEMLLRPALVMVSRGPAPKEDTTGEASESGPEADAKAADGTESPESADDEPSGADDGAEGKSDTE